MSIHNRILIYVRRHPDINYCDRRRGAIMKNLKTIIILTLITISAAIVFAGEPVGPSTSTILTDKLDEGAYPSLNISTIAGNVSEVNMTTWAITRSWAGFYGDVSGTIVLANSLNQTLYDWSVADPSGQIYAARVDSITWTDVLCASWDTLQTEGHWMGVNYTDTNGNFPEDHINNTFFNGTANPNSGNVEKHPTFYVSSVEILNDTCYRTTLHNSSEESEADVFREVLLADSSGTGNVIYTALLEQSEDGFNGANWDFEMLVAEDGHGTDTSVTQYYFWVAIE
ncbi:hypothetical protein GOV04_03185 [Candidatus Woesearchaeota archaeon]|nr:hypothetical protein [Candidatus Woesearchaeota archaeon]